VGLGRSTAARQLVIRNAFRCRRCGCPSPWIALIWSPTEHVLGELLGGEVFWATDDMAIFRVDHALLRFAMRVED
jgi:hypothetical protein